MGFRCAGSPGKGVDASPHPVFQHRPHVARVRAYSVGGEVNLRNASIRDLGPPSSATSAELADTVRGDERLTYGVFRR